MQSSTTPFLSTLRPADPAEIETKVCEFYLAHVKRIEDPHRHALGWTQPHGSPARMYYFDLPGGILEMEVYPDANGALNRRVTDFITDPSEVQEMLGRPVRPN